MGITQLLLYLELQNQCLSTSIRVRLFNGDDVICHMTSTIDLDMKNGYNSVSTVLRTPKSMPIHIYEGQDFKGDDIICHMTSTIDLDI